MVLLFENHCPDRQADAIGLHHKVAGKYFSLHLIHDVLNVILQFTMQMLLAVRKLM